MNRLMMVIMILAVMPTLIRTLTQRMMMAPVRAEFVPMMMNRFSYPAVIMLKQS